MLKILEKILDNNQFLETKFDKYPFQVKSKNDENLSSIFEDKINSLEKDQNAKIEKEIEGTKENCENNMILINYNGQTFNIYRKPVIFQLFNENQPIFKVYDSDQLSDVLIKLEQYYAFQINGTIYDSLTIINLKKEDKILGNIIIIPLIAEIFTALSRRIDFAELKQFESINIAKEILEPFFLYIEKKDLGYEKSDKFNNDLLTKNLTFIINDARKNFIEGLDDYAKINIQKEPMIIVGNDGIGKTLTLQLYTLIKLQGYKKFYFNLKLLEKCDPRFYFLIELMRGFISEDEKERENDFKRYINCISKYQDRDYSDINKIFSVLNDIIIDLEFSGKYIIILDQFNFEKINSDDFYNFRIKIPSNKNFKIIVCCSLIDNKNKMNLFSDYENIELYKFYPEFNNIIPENNKKNTVIEKEKQITAVGNFVDKFYLLKKRKRENAKKELIKENNNAIDTKEKLKENNPSINNKSAKKKSSMDILLDEGKYINFNSFFKPQSDSPDLGFSNKKLKIYYSNLISLEDMLLNNQESNDVIDCMSDFNFLPKYYYKFDLFKIKKIIEKENDIKNIIKLFYEEEIKKIKKNIKDFYSKKNLNQKNKNATNENNNVYQNLLKLKKVIIKSNETPINFPKLYKYCIKFPFKYLNIKIENEDGDIQFDNKLKNKKFSIRYSFPFVEKVIDKIIEEYDNKDKININELSGSAYGNALELKIRENMNNFKQKIEIRKVWALNKITENVKEEKLKEIKKEKKFNRVSRYSDLEDIVGVKELKGSFFYFKPENQDNKYFDSAFLIKKDDKFYLVVLQITKDKEKRKLKSKKDYSDFLKDNVLKNFNELYKIEIEEIYFWFILGNEIDENETLCKNLNNLKIKFAFYSLKNYCFYKERNKTIIDNINNFLDDEAIIFPYKDENENNNDSSIAPPNPKFINTFENMLYDEFMINEKVLFENVRNKCFKDNCGPKIGDLLLANITKKIGEYVPYNNEFKILFLFSFPSHNFSQFQTLENEDSLIYLLKRQNNIYIIFNNNYFRIDLKNNSLVICEKPEIYHLDVKDRRSYKKNEFDFSSMEDIYDNPLIYLYKIYYLGDELIEKNK